MEYFNEDGIQNVVSRYNKVKFICFFQTSPTKTIKMTTSFSFRTVLKSSIKEKRVSTMEIGGDGFVRFGCYENNKISKAPRDHNKDSTARRICLFEF